MTAKEKANDLVEKFLNQTINFPYIDTVDKQCIGSGYMTYKSAVSCAIIAVDEIIKEFKNSDSLYATNFLAAYWAEVKNELEKL